MFKLYTGCINTFLQHHCEINNIITSEQAGGKRNVWGCVKQLLINKIVLNEVRSNRRNLITIWLDYQKVFDSVPHSWMSESLRLAKVPNLMINAIESLTKTWTTNVCINGENDSYVSKYLKGIFQGDSLSVLLFILSLNPMSFLLNKLKGYAFGKNGNRNEDITHLFFIDDLKLFATNMSSAKTLLDLVTTFSQDIGMKFEESKCAYLMIERGKQKRTTEILEMNGTKIQPVKEDMTYKYLGVDENASYNGSLNKDRIRSDTSIELKKYGVVNSVDITSASRTMHLLDRFWHQHLVF